jgi:hypothetical protein
MNKRYWYLILITALFIVLIGSAIGCTTKAPLEEPAPLAAPALNANHTPASSPETGTTTPSAETETTSTGETQVGSDPVSGRNEEIDLSWEQLCMSSEYQVQIAKDPDFAIIVVDTGNFVPASSTAPAAYYPAGGRSASSPSALTPWANLESGHTYYWRVRVVRAATGEYIHSPWSEVKSFTVAPGLPASTPSYGPQPIYPNNSSTGCPVKPVSFSWSPINDAIKYKFVLAKDAEMTQVVREAEVTTTAFEYDGTLDYSGSYFWRVMALEPVPSDWSATFSFRTEAPPPPPPAPAQAPTTPIWAWAIIAIGAILIIVVVVFIFKVQRR